MDSHFEIECVLSGSFYSSRSSWLKTDITIVPRWIQSLLLRYESYPVAVNV